MKPRRILTRAVPIKLPCTVRVLDSLTQFAVRAATFRANIVRFCAGWAASFSRLFIFVGLQHDVVQHHVVG